MTGHGRIALDALTGLCEATGRAPQSRAAWRRESGLDVAQFDSAKAELLGTGDVEEVGGDSWPTYRITGWIEDETTADMRRAS